MQRPTSKRKRASTKERKERTVRYPDYHDHSAQSEEWVEERRAEMASKATTTTGAKKDFPNQLYVMLSTVDGTAHSRTVRWLPHGRSFAVLDRDHFVSHVLPTYFPSQTALSSFQRQLNSYGFRRLTHEEDGYYHELFLRSRPSMAALIPRSLRSQHSTRRRYDPTSAPNFYDMTWMPDISRSTDNFADVTGATSTATSSEDARPWVQPQLIQSLPPSSQIPRPVRSKTPRVKRRVVANVNEGQSQTGSKYCGDEEAAHLLAHFTENSASRDTVSSQGPPQPNALNATNFGAANDIPSPSMLSPEHYRAGYGMAEPRLHIHDNPFWLGHDKSAITNMLPHNDGVVQTEEYDAETSSESQIDEKLSEWVDFLGDVDLDSSSSTSNDEKKPRAY